MKSKNKKWIGAAALAAAAILAGRWILSGSADEVPAEDPSLLFHRSWIEKKPEKYTDYAHGLWVGRYWPGGYFERDSAYDHHSERFDYKRDRNKLQIAFPQTGRTAEFTFEIKACDAAPPFDLCLDLSKNPWGGPERYYGFRHVDDEAKHLGDRRRERPTKP